MGDSDKKRKKGIGKKLDTVTHSTVTSFSL